MRILRASIQRAKHRKPTRSHWSKLALRNTPETVGDAGFPGDGSSSSSRLRAKERTVDLRLIADKTTACERASDIPLLAAAGVPIWIDREARIVHAKTMVIDGAVTLINSMNSRL